MYMAGRSTVAAGIVNAPQPTGNHGFRCRDWIRFAVGVPTTLAMAAFRKSRRKTMIELFKMSCTPHKRCAVLWTECREREAEEGLAIEEMENGDW